MYERLGHAEVVQLQLDGGNEATQMRMFADRYFSQFKRSPFGGMQRLVRESTRLFVRVVCMLLLSASQDPQDKGPGYRNVVGIPGGMDSPLYPAFAAANKNGMKLVRGEGNEFVRGRPTEDDVLNTVYIVDSNTLPFYLVRRCSCVRECDAPHLSWHVDSSRVRCAFNQLHWLHRRSSTTSFTTALALPSPRSIHATSNVLQQQRAGLATPGAPMRCCFD